MKAPLNNSTLGKPLVLDPSYPDSLGTITPVSLDTRVQTLESVINIPDTGLVDRLGALELIVDTDNTGLVDKVAVLESVVSTAGTGLTARVTTLESKVAAAVADEDTVDGADATTTQALANALKIKVNAILTALRAAGLMEPDEEAGA